MLLSVLLVILLDISYSLLRVGYWNNYSLQVKKFLEKFPEISIEVRCLRPALPLGLY